MAKLLGRPFNIGMTAQSPSTTFLNYKPVQNAPYGPGTGIVYNPQVFTEGDAFARFDTSNPLAPMAGIDYNNLMGQYVPNDKKDRLAYIIDQYVEPAVGNPAIHQTNEFYGPIEGKEQAMPDVEEQGLMEMLGGWSGVANLTGTSLLGYAGNMLGTVLGNTVGEALGITDKKKDPDEEARNMLSLSKAALMNTNATGAMGQSAQRQAEIAMSHANEAGADAIFARAGQRGLADKLLSSAQAQNAATMQLGQKQAAGMQKQMVDAAKAAGSSPAAMMAIAREGGAQAGQNTLAMQAQAGQNMSNALGGAANVMGSANQAYNQAVDSRYQRNVTPRLNQWHDMSSLAISGLNSGTQQQIQRSQSNQKSRETLSVDPLGYLNSAVGQSLGAQNTRNILSGGQNIDPALLRKKAGYKPPTSAVMTAISSIF